MWLISLSLLWINAKKLFFIHYIVIILSHHNLESDCKDKIEVRLKLVIPKCLEMDTENFKKYARHI
jgi:hypothetical protein